MDEEELHIYTRNEILPAGHRHRHRRATWFTFKPKSTCTVGDIWFINSTPFIRFSRQNSTLRRVCSRPELSLGLAHQRPSENTYHSSYRNSPKQPYQPTPGRREKSSALFTSQIATAAATVHQTPALPCTVRCGSHGWVLSPPPSPALSLSLLFLDSERAFQEKKLPPRSPK